ncbi:MAG: PAS domain S-box protein [Sulfuricaulis sp.]
MKPVRSLSLQPATELLGRHGRIQADLMLEHITNAVFAIDRSDILTFVNRAGVELSGYASDELIGHPFSVIFSPATLPQALTLFQRVAVAGETVKNVVIEMVRKDGAHRFVNFGGSPFYEHGRITGVIGVAEDVTERRHTEQLLRASEQRFRGIFEQVAVGMVSVDPQQRFLSVNQRFCEFIGYSREQLLQMRIPDVTHPEDLDKDLTEFTRRIKQGISAQPIEKRYRRQDGSSVWGQVSTTQVLDASGQPAYYIGALVDISARKHAQQELLLKSTMLTTLQEVSPDGVLVSLGAGMLTYFNQRFAELWGLSREYLESHDEQDSIQLVLDKLVDPEGFLTRVKYLYDNAHEKSTDHFTMKDGRVFERYSAPMFDQDDKYLGRMWCFHDVSEPQRLLTSLAQNENLLRTLVRAIPDMVWLKDLDGVYLSCNPVFERHFGATEAEIIGKTDYDFVDQVEADSFRKSDRRALANGKPCANEAWLNFVDDGHRALFEVVKTPMYDIAGKLIGVLGIAHDITARTQAVEASRAAGLKLERLLDSMEEGVYEVDLRGNCIFVNQAFLKILGYQHAEQVLGKHVHELIHHSHADGRPYPASECRMYRAYQTGQTINTADEVFWHHDGSAIPVEYWSRPIVVDGAVTGAMATFIDISARKQTEQALRVAMEHSFRLLNSMAEGAYGIDNNGNCTFVNRSALQMLGYQDEAELLGQNMHEVIHYSHADASHYEVSECKIFHAFQTGESVNVSDEVFWHKDGTAIPVEYWSYPIISNDSVNGAIITFIDISERLRQQALLAGEKLVLELLARDESMPVVLDALARNYEQQYDGRRLAAVMLYDRGTAHLRISGAHDLPPALRRKLDHIAVDFSDAYHVGYTREAVAVSDIATDPRLVTVCDEAQRHGLKSCWSIPILSPHAEILGIFAVFNTDLSRPGPRDCELLERKGQLAGVAIQKFRAQESLATMAYYDNLTGLPNRALLVDRLRQAMIDADRHERLVALLFLDLDRFKNINDTLGHETGDLLLHQVAQRLQKCVRSGDTVSRPGGDEFIIVLAGVAHVDDVSRVAQKFMDVFSAPFEIDGHELFVTVSVGITLYPFDDRDLETLYRNADAAMYHAKEQGRNNFQFYRAEMNAQSLKRLTLENALRRALERDEFRLYYQPQVDLKSGRIIGAEALIRWQHPELGLVPPNDFISLAEDTGLIVPIGAWVLRQACAQARAWQDAGITPLRVAVNLSARQFREPNLFEEITHALQHAGVSSEWLEVEVTESLVMLNIERTIEVLHGLEQIGVSVAIDDFGTGYSSLSYLRRLPIDVIKIDRAFIEHINDNADDAAIAGAIIALGQSLQLQIIAEGVETSEQLDFLRHHGCDIAQGYYYSRPLPAADFTDYLRRATDKPR